MFFPLFFPHPLCGLPGIHSFPSPSCMHAMQSLEDLLPPPNEKERRRMALAVSCVALLITVVAALLVGFTLGLSHYMDAMAPQGES